MPDASTAGMSENLQPVRTTLKLRVAQLAALRDELRVKIHLAGMDAKDEWRKLEPAVEDAVKALDDAAHDADVRVRELVAKLERIRSSIH